MNPIRGNIPSYEENFVYQLKKVLKHHQIKTIDVHFDQIKPLCIEDQIDFFIQKAIQSYE